jgi:hypothetical protein
LTAAQPAPLAVSENQVFCSFSPEDVFFSAIEVLRTIRCLVGAYILATQLGREVDADPRWIARASRMSSEQGPAWAIHEGTVVKE